MSIKWLKVTLLKCISLIYKRMTLKSHWRCLSLFINFDYQYRIENDSYKATSLVNWFFKICFLYYFVIFWSIFDKMTGCWPICVVIYLQVFTVSEANVEIDLRKFLNNYDEMLKITRGLLKYSNIPFKDLLAQEIINMLCWHFFFIFIL